MNNGLAGGRLPEILLVEDNDNDVELTRQGFKLAKLSAKLHHARNGEECLNFLRKQGEYAHAPTPDLICCRRTSRPFKFIHAWLPSPRERKT